MGFCGLAGASVLEHFSPGAPWYLVLPVAFVVPTVVGAVGLREWGAGGGAAAASFYCDVGDTEHYPGVVRAVVSEQRAGGEPGVAAGFCGFHAVRFSCGCGCCR